MKKCNHENNTYYAEHPFRTWGFDKSISFNICADCGQMSDLEEKIIKKKKREVKKSA